MPTTPEHRIHGDGQLFRHDFDRPLSNEELTRYRSILSAIMTTASIQVEVEPSSLEESQLLLALRQRFEIAFSNGCPHPEKSLVEYLSQPDIKVRIKHVADLITVIEESLREDGATSFLYQLLLEQTNPVLRAEIETYHPTQGIEDEEAEHLPSTFTNQSDRKAYGLANDELFYHVILPLRQLIDDSSEPKTTTLKVLNFLEDAGRSAQTITGLADLTKAFLQQQIN